MQTFADKGFNVYASDVPLFGENVKRYRTAAKLTQEALAGRLKLKKPTPISLMEGARKAEVPRPERIKKIAVALDVTTWQLMEGVVTEYDRLRAAPAQRRKSVPAVRSQDTDEVGLGLPPTGGSDVPTSAHARIQQLTEQLAQKDAFLREVQEAAVAVVEIFGLHALADEGRAPRKAKRGSGGPGRTHR